MKYERFITVEITERTALVMDTNDDGKTSKASGPMRKDDAEKFAYVLNELFALQAQLDKKGRRK
jgi:hypothetical protein